VLGTAGKIAAPTPPSIAVCRKRRRGTLSAETTFSRLDKLASMYYR